MTNFPEQLALTAQETLDETINCLTSHIPLSTKGAYDAQSLFQILVRAASKGDTIENTARELKDCPGSNNIRYHYYGNPSEEEAPLIYRSQATNGTCSFYAYATLYVIKKGKRVTLAIRGVRWLDTKVAIITYLLAELGNLRIKVKKLLRLSRIFQCRCDWMVDGLGDSFHAPSYQTRKDWRN